MSDTNCGGYCCERFRFRYNETLEQLKEHAARSSDPEQTQIAEMVIYIGESPFDVEGTEGRSTHWYTCKHFDTETRLCKIYETRPKMCRSYNTEPWHACGLNSCKLPRPTERKVEECTKLEAAILL